MITLTIPNLLLQNQNVAVEVMGSFREDVTLILVLNQGKIKLGENTFQQNLGREIEAQGQQLALKISSSCALQLRGRMNINISFIQKVL